MDGSVTGCAWFVGGVMLHYTYVPTSHPTYHNTAYKPVRRRKLVFNFLNKAKNPAESWERKSVEKLYCEKDGVKEES